MQLALLKKATNMLVHPPLARLQKVASYTLKAPAKGTHSKQPRNIGVILVGQFYVYNADEDVVEEVNAATMSNFKAGLLLMSVQCISGIILREVNKGGGVTISWGKSPFVAPRP